ncbi:MAG: hypothetical protein RJA57_842 [Bacteroidota bacterium]|jgi:cell wall-associated NlpC family hydrolase
MPRSRFFIFGKNQPMYNAVVTVAAAPVRLKADHRSEMVNQLLFGERVRLIKDREDGWIKVRSLHDDYEGWVTPTQFREVTAEEALVPAPVATGLWNEVLMGDLSLRVPVGASLPLFDGKEGRIGELVYRFQGSHEGPLATTIDPDAVRELVKPWLGVPYLWGGRNPMGVDCSGFVQVIFKLMGYPLPRDARQQEKAGEVIEDRASVQPGDLAFFERDGRTAHVGILLGPDEVIHASGMVRIDRLGKKNLLDAGTGEKMYRVSSLRRYR